MAEYGIVMKIKDIKGNIQLADYKECIGVLAVIFSSAASRTSAGFGAKDSTSVSVAPITAEIHAGKWTPEIMQACYNLTKLGDVVFTQLAQSVDKESKGTPTVLQTLTLTNARCIAVGQSFQGDGERTASLQFEYDKILLEVDKKPADFTVRNVTEGAT
jgi:type VI protein secretion system component Hcp